MRDADIVIFAALLALGFVVVVGFELVLEQTQQPTRVIHVYNNAQHPKERDTG